MRQSEKTDTELFMALSNSYNSEEERREILKHTLDNKAGFCYNVDLQGSLGTVCAGITTGGEGYKFNLIGYPFHRMTFTISGQAKIYDEKDEYIADPGSLYYFPPKKAFTVGNNLDKPWKHAYVHFIGTDIKKLFSKVVKNSRNIWNVPNPAEIQSLFENIAYNCLEQSEHSQIICDSYLRILLIKLDSMVSDSHEHLTASRLKYLECYNFINSNFSSIISIEDVSDKCCISSIYLCRLFKKYSNTSPMAYVTRLKMNKAVLFLMQTDYSIKQISIMLNYDNQYYFSRAFKKIYGISPLKYREKNSF
ncbi:MAG: helix-turn-helix transcriptional regulator [Sedimentisphaeraceae bacterium JB056]